MLMGGHGQKEKPDDAHNRGSPETLYREMVNVSAALDRWPEKALEAAFAANGRVGEPKRLHGAALNRKSSLLSRRKTLDQLLRQRGHSIAEHGIKRSALAVLRSHGKCLFCRRPLISQIDESR